MDSTIVQAGEQEDGCEVGTTSVGDNGLVRRPCAEMCRDSREGKVLTIAIERNEQRLDVGLQLLVKKVDVVSSSGDTDSIVAVWCS